MGDATVLKMSEVSLEEESKYERTPFGKEMLKHFLFDPTFKNLNHGAFSFWSLILHESKFALGSFGTFPRAIREKQREFLDWCESTPDHFIRYESPKLIDQSRKAVSKLLNCPIETVVFVPNATTGVNAVVRNLIWNAHGKDEILYFRYDKSQNLMLFSSSSRARLFISRS
jgi:hypothetical protein